MPFTLSMAPPAASQPARPAAPSAATTTSHVVVLDFLRGVAALLVCLFHFTTGAVPTFVHPVTRFIGHRGYLGVEIFFVLSGFIMPYALHRSRYSWQQLSTFLWRRFVRIAPPAYVSMVLFILLDLVMQCGYGPTSAAEYGRGLLSARFVHNLFFTIPFTGHAWYNGIFWTLSIEFTFYLVLGVVYPLLDKSRFGLLLFGLALVAGSYIPGIPEQSLFRFSTLFTMGIAAWQYFEKKITLPYFLGLLLLFAAIGVRQLTLVPVLAALATVAAILYLRIQHPFASFLGKISYSLYLTHVVIGFSLSFFISTMLPVVNLATVSVVLLLCIGAAIAVAVLFYRHVELPFVRLASRLPQATRSAGRVPQARALASLASGWSAARQLATVRAGSARREAATVS